MPTLSTVLLSMSVFAIKIRLLYGYGNQNRPFYGYTNEKVPSLAGRVILHAVWGEINAAEGENDQTRQQQAVRVDSVRGVA